MYCVMILGRCLHKSSVIKNSSNRLAICYDYGKDFAHTFFNEGTGLCPRGEKEITTQRWGRAQWWEGSKQLGKLARNSKKPP